jgi:hypothetical protein
MNPHDDISHEPVINNQKNHESSAWLRTSISCRHILARLPRPPLSLTTTVMSPTTSAADPNLRFQSIFIQALQAYKNTTGKDLPSHPLFRDLIACDSTDAILTVLQRQLPGYDQAGTSHDTSIQWPWLATTVDLITQVSQTIGAGVGLVNLPNVVVIDQDRRSD